MKTRSISAFAFFQISVLALSSVKVEAQQLTMTPGSHFVINGSPSVIMNSSGIKNNGTFTPGSGTINFTGYSDTSVSFITGDSATTITNLSVSKPAHGVAIKSAVGITNVLTMSNGNLYPNSNLTLKSTTANTARVAPVATGSNIIGKANVERYIPSHRAWRLMTAPQTNAGSIYDAWENSQVYTAGKGTYITGPGPTATNGLDASPGNNYSMYTFSSSTQKFNVVTNTKVNISPGSNGSGDNAGYMVFVRGDRTASNLSTSYSNATTLNSLGNLQTGTQTFTASSVSGKYTMIGNPYASPIDFSTLTRVNLINRFYVWDPNLNTIGGFVVLDDLDGDGVYTKSVSGSNQSQIIQSTQAFFVQTFANGAASLVVNENNKSTTNNNLVFRPSSVTEGLRMNLYLFNADSSTTLADGALAEFNSNFSDSVSLEDAPKIGNMSEGLSLARYGKFLSIERRPIILSTDTLFLQLTGTTKRSYQAEFIDENLDAPGLTAFLQDTYLGTSTPLNMESSTKINFTISSDSSAVANRFRIVFKQAGGVPLAVTFATVKAYQKNTGINVEWSVQNEMDIKQYEVEKSVDGKTFNKATITIATGNNNSSVVYNWLDASPAAGINYYRVKSIDKNGVIKYSRVVVVTIDKKADDISIYPNPVTGNVINIQFSNQPLGNYQARLFGSDGALVYIKEVDVTSYNMAEALTLPSTLAKGNYELKTTGPYNVEKVQNIIIQ